MKELIIRSWCDRCESLGKLRAEARHTYTVGIVSGETRPALRVIELCDECDATEIDILSKLLASHSVPLDPKAAKTPAPEPIPQRSRYVPADKLTCKICDRDYHASSLAQHIWAVHRAGEDRPVQPKKCPECGVVNPTGMGQHRSQAHGWSAVTEAYKGLIT